ncbi:hypothetical protein [Ewingella americana]|uniref:hypothetical protein n=1 Tax=Ewingella americana TaxID=41202 RepID=UPI001639E355|nr:hypothetical protein [Ewingella americana]QMV54226.1 hypothetical protein GXP68_23465 [Ewingella americana]
MSSSINSMPKLTPFTPTNITKSSEAASAAKASSKTAAGQAKLVSVSPHSADALASKWDMYPGNNNGERKGHQAGMLKSVSTHQYPVRPYSDDEAAEMVTYAMRRNMGQKINNQMIAKGALWKSTLSNSSVASLSRKNIKNLHLRLQGSLMNNPLAPFEQAFLKKMLEAPLRITHATNALNQISDKATGKISLSSRQKLIRDGLTFDKDNSSADDIAGLANDDNVFFSLESGKDLQKKASRFGKDIVRFDFNAPNIQQHGTLILLDVLDGRLPSPDVRFSTLNSLPRNAKNNEIVNLNNHENKFDFNVNNSVFIGSDMKRGMALSIIDRCRSLSPGVRKEMLENEDVNVLINGLFRPQVMVPRIFIATPTDVNAIVPPRIQGHIPGNYSKGPTMLVVKCQIKDLWPIIVTVHQCLALTTMMIYLENITRLFLRLLLLVRPY